jgi:hypothetical protein
MRILYPYIDDKTLALQLIYQAFCAAYLSIGAPKIDEFTLGAGEKIDVESFKKEARLSDDDHVIKITYTLIEESLAYNNKLYLKAL